MSRRFRNASSVLAVSALFLGVSSQANATLVMDGGFETPALASGTFAYTPGGSAWTFTSSSGISNPNNNFDRSAAMPAGIDAPEGAQYAFLQDNGKVAAPAGRGAFSQTISGLNAGIDLLTIRFLAAGRPPLFSTSGANPFRVLLGGVEVFSVAASELSTSFASFEFSTIASASSLTLEFDGLGAEQFGAQDRTTFFDQVEVVATPTPEPSPIVLVGLFVACVATGSWFQRRRQVAAAA